MHCCCFAPTRRSRACIRSRPTRRTWGRGVGARLVDAAERQARAHGYTCLRLEIRADNAASLALFRGRGYREFGHHAGYYHDGMDALRLQQALAPRLPADGLTG